MADVGDIEIQHYVDDKAKIFVTDLRYLFVGR